jgi:membrane-associated phospholipid phosphatase
VSHGAARALAWTFAVAMVTFVALSRTYRGMHHPFDIAGGIVLGVVVLTVLVFVCRTAGATADARDV